MIPHSFTQIIRRDLQVAGLNPLDLDGYFRLFPDWNDQGGVQTIAVSARPHVARVFSLRDLRQIEAAHRDLAMIAAAIFRHQRPTSMLESPLGWVPGLEEGILWCARRLQTVPPLSTYGYCTQNPIDRERRFTARASEGLFIDAVRRSIWWQAEVLDGLRPVMGSSIKDPQYAELALRASESLGNVVRIMAEVIKRITPPEFSMYIRPFFDQQWLGGRWWSIASAAHTLMPQIDDMIWAAESRSEAVQVHRASSLAYQPEPIRSLTATLERKSLLNEAESEIERDPLLLKDPVAIRSLAALEVLMITIARFRGPHTATVKKNEKVRRELGMGTKGSGGEDLAAVRILRQETTNQLRRLQAVMRGELEPGS